MITSSAHELDWRLLTFSLRPSRVFENWKCNITSVFLPPMTETYKRHNFETDSVSFTTIKAQMGANQPNFLHRLAPHLFENHPPLRNRHFRSRSPLSIMSWVGMRFYENFGWQSLLDQQFQRWCNNRRYSPPKTITSTCISHHPSYCRCALPWVLFSRQGLRWDSVYTTLRHWYEDSWSDTHPPVPVQRRFDEEHLNGFARRPHRLRPRGVQQIFGIIVHLDCSLGLGR